MTTSDQDDNEGRDAIHTYMLILSFCSCYRAFWSKLLL